MQMTKEKAQHKICPFTLGGQYPALLCQVDVCMAWRVVHPKVTREDHSGGGDAISAEGYRTRRIARREGPKGSLGLWVLDEVGECARLFDKDK